MTLFVDNDIIHKLAALDMLDEMLVVLGVPLTEVRVLDTAKFRFKIRDPVAGAKRFGAVVHQRIASFLAKVGEITAAPPEAMEDLMAEVQEIDNGELRLFAATATDAQALLLTGDKRSLTALQANLPCAPIVSALEGRVICFEKLIGLLIKKRGFPVVQTRALAALDCDTALRAAFGSGPLTTEATASEALEAYERHLRERTGRMLIP